MALTVGLAGIILLRMARNKLHLGMASTVILASICFTVHSANQPVQITEQENKLRVEINGELFTEYHFKGAPHVFFYPLIGPGGLPMTRNFPMVPDSKDEDHDHPHHRSLWYSHGDVNKVDFWSESAKAGKILHDKFIEVKSGNEFGLIKSENKWVAPSGEVVCRTEQTVRIYNRPSNERMMDFEVTIKAGEKDVVFGDTKEGSFGIRVAESMRLTLPKKKAGEGKIVQNTGVKDGATWGKQAAWCDYYGPVKGKIVGIAVFDHPSNPRHPTHWHVRDYGLFAVNPFGIHDFEKKPAGTGDFKVEAGKSATFRYRVLLHEGDEQKGKVAERFQEYAGK
jgi:hypothetical protein